MSNSRRLRLMMLGLVTAALIAALWWAYSGILQLSQLRAQTTRLDADLAIAQTKKTQLKQMQEWVSQRQDVRKRAEAAGLVESQWGSRVIQQPTSLVMRDQAEKLIRQLASKAGEYWFLPESFDVAVVTSSEGLFTQPTAADRGFNVQVKGTFYFKAAGQ